MVETPKLIPVVLVTAAAAFAQFDAPVDPLSLAYTDAKQQNRTFSSSSNYNALTHGGMPVGLIDMNRHYAHFEMGLSGQKLVGDSSELKHIAGKLPQFTVGSPDRVAFSGHYAIMPITDKLNDSLNQEMPQHRFGGTFAVQAPKGVFRFGLNLEAFMGRSLLSDTSGVSRFILGVENGGISFGTAPSKMFSMDAGFFVSGFIDTLDGPKDPVQKIMIRQERVAEVELPRVSTHIRIGDSTLPVMSSFSYTYGKKQSLYAVRDANGPLSNAHDYGIALDSVNQALPNLDPIITDSITWDLANRGHIVAVANKFEINPAFEIGYSHNRVKRMIPGKDNKPWQASKEDENFRWETSSLRFGLGLDMRVLNCVDYWTEYGHSNLKLNLTGSNYDSTMYTSVGAADHSEQFNRFATGAELAVQDIPALKFPKAGQLFFNMSFQTLQETALHNNFYGASQYKHFTAIDIDTQMDRYMPWIGAKQRVKTNDIALGLRGSVKEQLIEIGGRIHFLNQTFSAPDVKDFTVKGPKYQIDFTYNLTEKAYKNRLK